LFFKGNLEVFLVLTRGDGVICGLTNRMLCDVLGKGSVWVSRLLLCLRLRGLIKKVSNLFRYYP